MDKRLIIKILGLCGSALSAVAAMIITDLDTKRIETKVYNDVMNNVMSTLGEGKEVV